MSGNCAELGFSHTCDLTHLCQRNLIGVLRQLNDLVAVALVKGNIARHQCVRCQVESFYVRMCSFDGTNKRRSNASSLIGRFDADATNGTDGPLNYAPSRADDSLTVSHREHCLSTDVQVDGRQVFGERGNLQVVTETSLLLECTPLYVENDFSIRWNGREDLVHVLRSDFKTFSDSAQRPAPAARVPPAGLAIGAHGQMPVPLLASWVR